MWSSLERGHKLALIALAIELGLALILLSPSLGLFALIALPVVGIAWIPAAGLMFSDLRQKPDAPFAGYLVAGVTGLAGLLCLYWLAKWTVLGILVR